jgi:serine/threonine-protein kinase RsbW
VRRLRPWLEAVVACGNGDRAELLGRIELALHELCVNVIDHAYGRTERAGTAGTSAGAAPPDIVVELWNGVSGVHVRTVDRGRPFDAAAVRSPQPDEPQVHGYGLMIIEQLVDDLRYERRGDRNVWCATVRCPAAVPLPAGHPDGGPAPDASPFGAPPTHPGEHDHAR